MKPCPACQREVQSEASECPHCGVVFAKWKAPAARRQTSPDLDNKNRTAQNSPVGQRLSGTMEWIVFLMIRRPLREWETVLINVGVWFLWLVWFIVVFGVNNPFACSDRTCTDRADCEPRLLALHLGLPLFYLVIGLIGAGVSIRATDFQRKDSAKKMFVRGMIVGGLAGIFGLFTYQGTVAIQHHAIEMQKEFENTTSLFLAAKRGSPDTIYALLAKGADPNEKGENGETALIWSAVRGRAEVVKALLAKGADVNAKDNNGRTALMWAVDKRCTETVRLLKQAGAGN